MRELGQPELGVVGREQHVAEERTLPHPADAPPLDRAHDRDARRHQEPVRLAVPERDVLVVALPRRSVAELAHVAPGRERPTLGAPEHAVDVVARVELLERGPELTLHVVAHRVELLGPVEREDREVIVVLEPHRSVGHRRNLRQLAPAMVRSNVAATSSTAPRPPGAMHPSKPGHTAMTFPCSNDDRGGTLGA